MYHAFAKRSIGGYAIILTKRTGNVTTQVAQHECVLKDRTHAQRFAARINIAIERDGGRAIRPIHWHKLGGTQAA